VNGEEINTRSWREPKRLAISLLGFVAGLGLLVWVILQAVGDEESRAGWDRMLDASPWLVLAMFACTLASSVVNGLSFHLTSRPIGAVDGWSLQRLNFVAGLANYAPVRLGPLARIVWHLNVDRMRVVTMSAWFAVMAILVLLALGPAMTATFARPQLDLVWGLLLVVQVVIAVLMLRWVGAIVFRRHGQDIDRILRARGILWGAIALRLADLAAFWGRMWAASAILGMSFTPGQLLLLALVAYVGSLVPFGRAGFQQFLVASAAGWINMEAGDVASGMAQLALLESAAEFAFYLVTGAICLPWYRRRMTEAAAARRAETLARQSDEPAAAAATTPTTATTATDDAMPDAADASGRGHPGREDDIADPRR
jgi:hypothetical protein